MNQINKEYLLISVVELKLIEIYTEAKKIGLNTLGIDKYPRSSAFKYYAIDSINSLLILFKKNI